MKRLVITQLVRLQQVDWISIYWSIDWPAMTFDWMDQRTTTSIEQEAAMLSKFRAIWTETKEAVSKFQQLQTR